MLGYVFFFFFGSVYKSQIAPSDESFFRANWFARLGVIFLALALVLSASIGKKPLPSKKFWIVSATCLIAMFFLGPQFLGIFVAIYWALYFLYKSAESFKGFFAHAAKSYRQLRSEIEKN